MARLGVEEENLVTEADIFAPPVENNQMTINEESLKKTVEDQMII